MPIDIPPPAALEERVRELERSRIARDLHDELGAQLTGLGMALGLLQDNLAQAGEGVPAGAVDQATYARQLLGQAHDAMHAIINELRPPIVEFGLADTLQWQAREFARQSGLACHLRCEGATGRLDALDETTVITLLRVVREALGNVGRHARARRVELTLSVDDDALRLAIADDGCGGDLGGAHQGSGLANMHHRARALGATLQIRSAAGQGTTVVLTLPVTG